MSGPRIVIVGASLAGATAAATLRDDGFDGESPSVSRATGIASSSVADPRVASSWASTLKDGIVRATVGLNRGGDPEDPKPDGELKAAVHVIRNRVAVDPATLIDESVDLRRLVTAR
jgi:hypothetical protein